MRTKLPCLQEHSGRLGWWTPKTNPTKHKEHSDTRYTTAEEFLPDSKCMTTSGAGLSAPQTQDYQVPQNSQCTQTQSFDVPDRYADQIHLRREWEEKMEKLNEKYRLDYFSYSELDSESAGDRTIDMTTSMKHSSDQLQTKTQKF